MKITKLTTNPADYLFAVYIGEGFFGEPNTVRVAITPRAYFEESGYMYDQHLPLDLDQELFDGHSEGMYEYTGTPSTLEHARAQCQSLGMKESSELLKLVEIVDL